MGKSGSKAEFLCYWCDSFFDIQDALDHVMFNRYCCVSCRNDAESNFNKIYGHKKSTKQIRAEVRRSMRHAARK